jgi:ribosome-binding protein aMBF1 (putative translation factor)
MKKISEIDYKEQFLKRFFPEKDPSTTTKAEMLLLARSRKLITQIDLAKTINAYQPHIAQMEHGTRTIGKKMARKLAKALDVSYRIFV